MQKGPRDRSRLGWPHGRRVSGSPGTGCHPSMGEGPVPGHGKEDRLRMWLQPPTTFPGSTWRIQQIWGGPRDSVSSGQFQGADRAARAAGLGTILRTGGRDEHHRPGRADTAPRDPDISPCLI